MTNRVMLAVIFVAAGILCVAVTLIAVAWVDNVARHERTAEIQLAVWAELQGKMVNDQPPYSNILSPLMSWIAFGLGSYLVGTGFVIGVRSLSIQLSPGKS
jgi:hypothetical protein